MKFIEPELRPKGGWAIMCREKQDTWNCTDLCSNARSTPDQLCHFRASYLISEPQFPVSNMWQVPQLTATYNKYSVGCSSDYYINILQRKTFRAKDAKWLTFMLLAWNGLKFSKLYLIFWVNIYWLPALLSGTILRDTHLILTSTHNLRTILPILGMRKLRHQKVTQYLKFTQVAGSKAKISNTAGYLQSHSACWLFACLKNKKINHSNKLLPTSNAFSKFTN